MRDSIAVRPRGRRVGKSQRVTATATMSPVIENKPSCAKPVKVENSMALKPATDVSTPSRSVGQMRASVSAGWLPGAV